MQAPFASTYTETAKHPYMQKTKTVDFCTIIHGEVTLVLETEECRVSAGDVVVLRGVNHAWSNHSSAPVMIAIASHDAEYYSDDNPPA
jgi:quercetin dioxygenase-like cupin family protein